VGRAGFVQGTVFGGTASAALCVGAVYIFCSVRASAPEIEGELRRLNALYGPPAGEGHGAPGLAELDRSVVRLDLTGDGEREHLVLFGRARKWAPGPPPAVTVEELLAGAVYCQGFALFQRCGSEWRCSVLYGHGYDMGLRLTSDFPPRLQTQDEPAGLRSEWRWENGERPWGRGWRHLMYEWDAQGSWRPFRGHSNVGGLFLATYPK
jgi:hypothetical protein